MTPRYDSLRKTERDAEIRKYATEHPDYSHREIAEHFGLCRSRVTQILCKARNNHNGGKVKCWT